ncbi:MAG: SH3 domain-containing protein [Prochlorothrix sp.]|nr:SH3 domain-containing protein [Prochlorothrix sp.]
MATPFQTRLPWRQLLPRSHSPASTIRSGLSSRPRGWNFGTQTQDALIRFQSISDLEVDGVAGLGTAEALGLDTSDTSPYAPGQGCDTTDVAARVEEEAAPAETTDEPLASSRFYRVTADMLNVRSGPGTEYTIISSLMAGDRISGRASDSGWVRLGSGNWVAGAYLTEVQADEALASAVSESKAARIRVTTDALNARIWPSLNAPIVAVLQAGEEYDTTGSITEDGWVQLIGGNWVAQSHVVPVDDTTPEGSAMEVSDTSTTETETQEASTQDTEAQNGTIQAAEPQTPETSVARVSTLGSPLFVRATPNGDIVDTLANGAQVNLSGRTEAGWAQLQNGFWVAQDYLVS